MKKIIYIALAAAAIAAVSCQKSPWSDASGLADQGLTLSFSSGEMVTKADVADVNNEKRVDKIEYFFFPVQSDGTVADDATSVLSGTIQPEENDRLNETYTTHYDKDDLRAIPGMASRMMVFAVANYNGESPLAGLTWKAMHELEVGATFHENARWPRPMATDDEDLFFVMTGEKLINLRGSGTGDSVTEIIPLSRLASKVTVTFTFADKYENGDITWVPQSASPDAQVYLSNAIDHTTLGGPLTRPLVQDSWDTFNDRTRDVFEYAYDKNVGDGTYYYYTYPYYESGDDYQNQPFLKLVLPWFGYKGYTDAAHPGTLTKQREVYYKIALPREALTEPNRIYQYAVTVNLIGSEPEVLLECEQYTIKNWSTDEAISSNVGLGRYISLDIPKDTYDMYGSQVEILYVSSGEVEISNLRIYTQNLTGSSSVDVDYINGRPGQASSYKNGHRANDPDSRVDEHGNPDPNPLSNWVHLSEEGTMLVVDHTMHTALTAGVDIAPFTFVVTLHLKGETSIQFDRTVTITQYPPIYVQIASPAASATAYLHRVQYSGTSRNAFNNHATAENQNGFLGRIGASSTAFTRTIVNVSTLANLDPWAYRNAGVALPVIGDPRVRLGDKYPVNPDAANQRWLNDDLGDASNNYIADYLYADVDKSNVIAPRFMVSSGYAGCDGNHRTNWIGNVERCAAYQEAGYPAGRWRLPTEAEILFVYTLGASVSQGGLGVISNPFYDGHNYWANSGKVYRNGGFNTDTGTNSSRCVYDLWYWGDDPVLTDSTDPSITEWSGFMTSK